VGGAGIERRRFTIHDLRFTIYSLTEIRFTKGHESRGFAQKVDRMKRICFISREAVGNVFRCSTNAEPGAVGDRIMDST
jgi:hypothetical protein